MTKIAFYQDALREKKEAEGLWARLHRKLASTAKFFATGSPTAFMMSPQQNSANSYETMPFREVDWPTGKEIAELAHRVAAARDAVKVAWNDIEEADRIGLSSPD